MISIALVEQSCKARSAYLAARQLPRAYMEDFSIIGIEVTDYHIAHAILSECGYAVAPCPGGADVSLRHISQLPQLLNSLHERGVDATISDVADTIYQA